MFNGNQKIKRKRGKPIVHPPVLDVETQDIYESFTEAAEAINGDRNSVRRVCEGIQSHCNGHVFRYLTTNEWIGWLRKNKMIEE